MADTTSTSTPAPAPASDEQQVQTDAQAAAQENGDADQQHLDSIFQVTVKLPHEPFQTQVTVSPQEQVQDLRQSIIETPQTFQYSCFHLEHSGERINDFVELSEVPGLQADSELTLVEDPYTEKEARLHVIRVRELLGAAGDRTDMLQGIMAGLSLHDTVGLDEAGKPLPEDQSALTDYDFKAPGSAKHLLPPDRKSVV